MDLLTKAELLAENGEIRFIDFHFARQLKLLDPVADENALLAAMLVSNQSGKGDVCIDLEQLSERQLFTGSSTNISIETPPKSIWLQSLKDSGLVSQNEKVGPLTLAYENYLFLTRYWDYETSLASDVVVKASANADIDIEQLKSGLVRYFSQSKFFSQSSIVSGDGEPDWQMLAALSALLNNFTVITGGPGTGKTTTVTKILALFAEQNIAYKKKIVLAAPTGKAANRLSESIKKAKAELRINSEIAELIPEDVLTIHRLLGTSPAKASCYYNADNKLHLDLLVVDEASMIDLAMMSKLMQALPDNAQIILLGDMNQLASVESGSILADICATGLGSKYSSERSLLLKQQFGFEYQDLGKQNNHPLGDRVVHLKKSYRFDDDSGIGMLAGATNEGDVESFFQAFSCDKFSDISWSSVDSAALRQSIGAIDIEPYKHYMQSKDAEQALERMTRFQILSPVRDGVFGVNNLNKLIKERLQRSGLIYGNSSYFHGQPIMVIENSYKSGLYNGDVGIIWNEDGELKGYFPMPEGGTKRFSLAKLPAFETVFAMTVHKSQGSEFDNVLVVFPDQYVEHLTKELLYTAITRAKKAVSIFGEEKALKKAISTKVNRSSLLKRELMGKIAKQM